MTRRGTSRGLVVLTLVIVVLLLVEGALVAYVFISPNASRRFEGVAASIQEIWSGDEDRPGLRTRVARSAHGVFEDWVVPLWSEPSVPVVEPEFTACVECHEDYATQRRFNVHMNHPLHAELGLACETCHPQNPHPNPPRPQEGACAECHDVDDKEGCSYCHPPASLPHFYSYGAEKQSVVDCTVCHPKKVFTGGTPDPKIVVGTFDGSDERNCLSCHQDTTCSSCHGQPHPSGWVNDHGGTVFGSEPTTCYTCHAGNWCSDRCHAGVPPQPIPPIGVRP